MQIRQIIDKINDNQLFVPAFQREYVWKRSDAKSLFTSLIRKYPTGTLLTWETTSPPELKGPVKYTNEMGAVKLILDGQQRITTIYIIVEGKLPPYYSQKEIKNDITGLHVNLQTLELEYYKKQAMENNPLWVDLTDIFQGKIKGSDIRKSLKARGALTDELENLIDENFEAVNQGARLSGADHTSLSFHKRSHRHLLHRQRQWREPDGRRTRAGSDQRVLA